MFASQIKKIVAQWPAINPYFRGVFSIDNFPDFLEIDEFAIINTSKSHELGKHWFLTCQRDFDFLEIFDPLGTTKNQVLLFQKYDCYIEHNLKQYQDNNSSNCALFCLYFVWNRYLNPQDSFEDLLSEIFTDNLKQNEGIVIRILQKYLN